MSNTKNLANFAAALDDAASGEILQSTGSGGVTFAAASGGGGGSMTVYNDLNGTDGTPSGYTYLTNASSPSNGDLAFVTANNTVYVRASSGWRKIATIQESPGTITGHLAGYPTFGQNATTDITLSSTDPEGFDVTWSYVVGGNGTLSGSNINNSNGDTLASIAVQTANANSGGTNTITYRITRETTTVAGDFTITFTATDSQSTGTSDTGAISFELAFAITDSHYASLLMAADGSAGDNNDITDSSSSNHTITVNGDAHAGTFSPYRHGGYSTYFDGSGDFLTAGSSGIINFGIGDFTVEFYINTTAGTGAAGVNILNPSTSTGSGYWGLLLQNNKLRWNNSYNVSNLWEVDISNELDGSWHHMSIVRSSGTFSVYVDGTSKSAASGTFTDSTNYSGDEAVRIGEGNANDFTGYLSDVRIVKGTAITPPSGGPTQRLTAVTNTSLLTCHLPYIADGSSNGHSITISGDIEAKPFGPYDYDQYSESVNGGSIHFDGTDDYLTVYDTGLSLGNNSAFTVEFWFLTSKNPDQLVDIWSTYSGSTASMENEQLKFAYTNVSTGAIYFYDKQNSNNILQVTRKLGRNTWNHFCWTRDASNNHKFYINGEQIGTSTSSTSYDTNRWVFGLREYNLTGDLEGNISDFRLVKGTVVYSGEFTPPTGPLTTTGGTYSDTTNVNTSITSSHTKLLISGTDAHVIDKSQNSNVKLGGSAAASTDQSKFTGTASLKFYGNSNYALAENVIPINTGDFTYEGWIYTVSGQTASANTFFDTRSGSTADGFYIMHRTDNSNKFRIGTTGTIFLNSNSSYDLDTWHHWALVRSGTTCTFYINGYADPTTFTSSMDITSEKLTLGTNFNGTGNTWAYLQDVRITVGKARYTSNFTVPSTSLKA